MAMRMGKHCFTQKPLTWSIYEARVLRELAAEKKLATQMGNQGTAENGFREGVEVLLRRGPRADQGGPRLDQPPDLAAGDGLSQGDAGHPEHRPLGGVPRPGARPALQSGLPSLQLARLVDFGTGALGDMACHTINIAAMGLELFDPESVEVVDTSGIVDKASYPVWSIIRTQFGKRGKRDPLTMTWYDGGKNLPEDKRGYTAHLQGQKAPGSGLIIVGEKGTFFSENDYGSKYALLPRDRFQDVAKPEPSLPRSPGHFREWVDAIQAGDPSKALSNFDYAGRLTETVLLGVVP